MSRVINALERGELQRGLADVRKDVAAFTAELTGPNSDAVKAAAKVFVTEARRLVSVRGAPGEHAAPGAPPLAQRRKLRKSITTAVVDGVRRVGSGYFVARIQEFGTEDAPPHPYMRPALENVQEQMVDVVVSDVQKKVGD